MKQIKLLASALLIALISALTFGFFSPKSPNSGTVYFPPPSNNNLWDKFLFGAMYTAGDEGYGPYSHYHELGFNLWHIYVHTYEDLSTNKHYPYTWLNTNDELFKPLNMYASSVVTRIEDVNDNPNPLSTYLLHRPKIEYLCYGQRSDYQCETN